MCTYNKPHATMIIPVRSANEMLQVVLKHIPADIFIGVDAVTDWSVKHKSMQIRYHIEFKGKSRHLVRSSVFTNRPKYVIGFALETDKLEEHALKNFKKMRLMTF